MAIGIIEGDMTLNEVILACPEALAVLGRLGMDACCGGALPLQEAAKRHGHDPEAVILALREGCGSGAGASA